MHAAHKNLPASRRTWLRLEKCVFFLLVLAGLWWGKDILPLFNQWSGASMLGMQSMQVIGDTTYASRELAEERLARAVTAGPMNTDLRALEELLQTDPWVADAIAELVWPFGLEVRLIEHKVAARWGEHSLLSDAGVIFTPRRIPEAIASRQLPVLYSEAQDDALGETPTDRSVKLLTQLADLQAAFDGIERRIVALRESAQFSLTLWLDDGVRIAVGRKDQLARVQRLARVYSAFFSDSRVPASIDLRYPTSVAVRYGQEAS